MAGQLAMARQFSRADAGRRSGWPAMVLVVLPVLALGYLLQSRTYLNHDVAWTLYAGRLLLGGAGYGTDIIDPNLPFAWWFAMLPNAAGRALSLDVVVAFRLIVVGLVAVSLAASACFLRAAQWSRPLIAAFLAICALFLTAFVHRDFGQREHLAAILALPYVLAAAHRMDARTMPLWAGLAVGAAAGAGLAIKPYFGLVAVAVEAMLLWRRRDWKMLVRPEAIGAIAAVALLLVALLLTAPAYIGNVIPDHLPIYWAFSVPLTESAGYLVRKFGLVVPAVALVMLRQPGSQAEALALAGCGFLGAMWMQGEYFTYHAYPAYLFLSLGLVASLHRLSGRSRTIACILSVAVLLQAGVDGARQLVERTPGGGFGRMAGQVTDYVAAHVGPGQSFTAISTHPFPGFPVALYARRDWTSRSISRLYLPAVVKLRSGPRHDPGLLRFAERKARAEIMRDMALAPAVVLVDVAPSRFAIGRRAFDYLAFYREDPAFREVWRNYEKAPRRVGGFEAYIRGGAGGRLPPSPALSDRQILRR